ncbi:hypothetical protein C8A03DRAFT_16119 [Achaetomium macrosporum]|uniref:Uncharacterized protein n=1 Tax=Achaetomium macrosporum TaxID=79813 RepID=A0AAN7C977_9PEZI|nr:hypothetical protein C8A03DRAFT_16119 [Achaetomium macrosporum]
MNRFRTKKKAKDDLSAGRSSEDSEQSSLSFFRKGKKVQQEEVKKEFDLSNALPSNDDFRTSLLMNNLSARFSMLREQDDPNTKIGKASDDSVLYPKRQSRLADFGFSGSGAGLSDIAEVESIRGPNFLRTTSVASDDPESGSGGSVMTRAKPTEGNVLFGGRQKIYKIPAGSGGGLTGRALYDDDVALSAFQRWRQAEKERSGEEQNNVDSERPEEMAEQSRSESPPPAGYNRKRETSSTTSSASIIGRNSTAATSITSQGTNIAKDTHSVSTVATSATASAIPERSVARTRRLYEQGLNQDKHEQQGSVLSRFESLTRQRALGTRTPDAPMNAAFQTDAPADRFPSSSRTLLGKVSAPNLRSASPTAPSGSFGVSGLGVKVATDTKPNAGGLPPLSPPVSETGEQPILPILPKDVGKATAMGLIQKPSGPYDESQYVQRQLQLQQGRETPTQRHSAGSNDAGGSRSQNTENKAVAAEARPEARDTRLPPTPVTDTETPQSTTINVTELSVPPEVNVERPSDNDHPAFRQSTMPTPLSTGVSPSPKPAILIEDSQQPSPEDSPTLGPAAGLSGLVRQHLRTESIDSSVSGAGFDVSGAESRLNPWPSSGRDWNRSPYDNSFEASGTREETQFTRDTSNSNAVDRTSTATEDETVEFANQLADARRRVREKLTSYVESDSSRAGSPQPLPADSPSLSAQSLNPLGILKQKSSRGSLIDRSRNVVSGQPKGLKILGLGTATMSTSPQPGKQSFEDRDYSPLETMKEEVFREDGAQASYNMRNAEFSREANSMRDKDDDDSNTHPGLKAFRQARRELQRRKELETLARHQISQTSQSPDQALDQANDMRPAARADRGPRQRTPSGERRPPPVTYRQRHPSDEQGYSSPNAMRPSGERSRSGSETSGGRSTSRPPPPRLRTNTNTHDQLGPPASGRPMMRSPGLPGTDIKGSPVMPPYPYPGRGVPSPAPSPHLALHSGRPGLDVPSAQPSPISPIGLPSPSPYTIGPAGSPVGTPTSAGSRPRQASSAAQSPALGPANGVTPGPMKRPVDKREISEPTFVMSTSRVPTTTLPHHAPPPQYPPPPQQPPPIIPGMGDGAHAHSGPRSRSNSRAGGGAPPVPPINPRRRREDSRTRTPQADDSAHNSDYEGNRTGVPGGDHEGGNQPDQRQRLRKPHPEMQAPGPRPLPGRLRDNGPQFVAKGPPATRSVATSNAGAKPGMGIPGGMI